MVRHLSTAAALALLGAAPSQAYLSGRLCCQDKQSYRSSGSLYAATSSAPGTRIPGEEEHGSDNRRMMTISTAEARVDGATAETGNNRRWINDVKSGDKIIGYVKDTTNFAAFVDVGVVRRGTKVSPKLPRLNMHRRLLPDHVKYAAGGFTRNLHAESY